MAARITYWKPANGASAAVEISDKLRPHVKLAFIQQNVVNYKSADLKVGIDVTALALCAPLLAPLFELDSRGGFFGQADIEAALGVLFAEPQLSNTIIEHARLWGETVPHVHGRHRG